MMTNPNWSPDLTAEENTDLDQRLQMAPGPLTPPKTADPATEKKIMADWQATVTGFETPSAVHPFIKTALPILTGIGAGAVGGPLVGAGAAGLTAGALQGPEAGILEGAGFLGGGLVGKGVGAGVAALGKKKSVQFFAEKADELVELVKSKVPAWASLPGGAKGLVKMFQGQDALSAEFDKELTKQVGAGLGKEIVLSMADAQKLGAQTIRAVQGGPGPLAPGIPTHIVVDAADAVPKIVGRWKKDPGLYRRVVEELDRIGVGDPKAREAYRWGSGTIQYLNQTKALEAETFHLDRAMAGLVSTKPFELLRKRGMLEFANVIRGSGDLPVTPLAPHPLREAAGGLAGAAAGGLTGHPIIGFGAGREAVRQATQRGFANIPQGPLGPAREAIRVGSPLVGGGLGGLAASPASQTLPPEVTPQEDF